MVNDKVLKTSESVSAIEVNGRVYDLQLVPDYTDALVAREQADLLLQIDLNELNDNLYLSVELLFVAYNGVAGAKNGELQAEINNIMGKLALLCNKCVGTMSTFKDETQNIINELGQTYRFLISGKEKLAVKKLRHCGESSKVMSERAKELSLEFIELQKSSVDVRSNAIKEEASEYDKKVTAEKAIREFEAKRKTEEQNQMELVTQVAKMQKMYDDAKSREEKAAKKSLIMSITSTIVGAIGSGLGAYSAIKNPVGNVVGQAAESQKVISAQKSVEEKKVESDNATAKLVELEAKVTTQKNKIADLNKEITQLELDAKIITDVEESVRTEEQQGRLNDYNTQLDTKKKELKDLEDTLVVLEKDKEKQDKVSKDLTAIYGAAAASLDKLSGSFDKMAATAANAEEAIHQEKMKILDKQFELEAEKRASLIAMVDFAEKIKNSTVEAGNAEVTVNSLHAAIEALGKIVSTLTNASLFWEQMSDFCNKMAEKGFQADLEDLLAPDSGLTLEERVEEYQGKEFMFSYLKYLCQWVAINGLSGEYLISASNAQKKCLQNMAKSPTIEEARRNAPQLAKDMGVMLNQKILSSASKSSSILQEKARMNSQITK